MKTWHLILTLTACLLCAGCSWSKDSKAADAAIAHFHDLYNQGKPDAIWTEAGVEFAQSQPKFAELVGAMQRKLGRVKSTTTTSWKINSVNFVTTMVLGQETVFEQGQGRETFAFKMMGGKAMLQGYAIQSTDLMVK